MRKWIKYAAFALSGAYLLSRLFVKKEDEEAVEVTAEETENEENIPEEETEESEEENLAEQMQAELAKQERLLSLQVDLVLANYPEEKRLMLKQDIAFHDRRKLEDLINTAQTKGYQLAFSEEALQLSRILDKQEIKEEVLAIAKKARQADALYRGFDVRPE